MYLDENLYFLYISLKTGYINYDCFEKSIDDYYIKDCNNDNGILYELEWASNDFSKIINILDVYLYDKITHLNYSIVWNMIIDTARKKYEKNENLRNLTKTLYEIWNLLPSKISHEKPFITLNYLDDIWTCDEKRAHKEIEDFLMNTGTQGNNNITQGTVLCVDNQKAK